jgi:erythronate-4-phosphate dehydrogenase
MKNIVIDENIPFAKEAFSDLGKVTLIPGREITNDSLKSADILITRSVTKVNESLLKDTPVEFVGTATIGTDHLDLDYLNSKNIRYESSPGCNSNAVTEYIYTALIRLAIVHRFNLADKSIGIIGYGNIGSKVAKVAESFSLQTLINDPPLQRITNTDFFVSYKKALEADIITFHVPLNMEGIDKTYHLLSNEIFREIDSKKIIINASRGSVIANNDLKEFLIENKNIAVLDVWENEPEINTDLLQFTAYGTPHIAGYSMEGKVNGTVMIYESLCRFLKVNPSWKPALPKVKNPELNYAPDQSLEDSLNKIICDIYNIQNDDKNLRKVRNLDKNERGKYFDYLRKNYPVRREFSNYTIKIRKELIKEIKVLKALRFNVKPV